MALPALQQRDEDQLRDVANALREEYKLYLTHSAITIRGIQDLEASANKLPPELVERLLANHRRQLFDLVRQLHAMYEDSVALLMTEVGRIASR